MRPERIDPGFTLVELLLAAGLGVLLCNLALQLLGGHALQSGVLAQRWQQRRLQRRTLQLLKTDLAQADHWQLKPVWNPQWSCSVGSRQPLLAIHSADGSPPVVYSLGAPPSAIWRRQVLVRCGPSFDLQGRPNRSGAYQNRVVLDQVEALLVKEDPDWPLLRFELQQQLPGSDQPLRSSAFG